MKTIIQVIALSGALALPAFGQEQDTAAPLTCAEFLEMDSEARMKAVEKMQQTGEAASPPGKTLPKDTEERVEDRLPTGDEMAEQMVTSVRQACERYPAMSAQDAMRERAGY